MAITEPTTGGRVVEQGIGAVKVVLAAACNPGDLLGVSANTWVLADGNNTVYAELVAGEKGASGDTITAYRIARISGYTGTSVGVALYLSDTAGAASESAGTVAQVVGLSLSASEILLAPRYQFGGQLIPGAVKLFLRDSGLFIHSNADGKLTISADGSGTDDITLAGTVTFSDDMVMGSGKLVQADADKIKAGSIIIPQRVVVNAGSLSKASNTVDSIFFIADRAYEIVSVVTRATVLENSAADSTIMIEKVPSGTAVGSGTDCLAAAVNLKTGLTVNTNATLALHGTAANYQLAAGDALGIDFGGTAVTEFVGDLTVTLKAI